MCRSDEIRLCYKSISRYPLEVIMLTGISRHFLHSRKFISPLRPRGRCGHLSRAWGRYYSVILPVSECDPRPPGRMSIAYV